ncbi:hypothetical protein ACE1B6_27970 [Aerosakkonemataceae cyanobacterium BLCC-F154]|uniref:Homeobox domain-containing protein n=1 Tax=Floridaenema fluviatile BLCC-F154 TaxID=3153640 RepID=A0ABV4YK93_9CYAN
MSSPPCWQEREFSGLEDTPKPGRRRKWQPEDLAEIERQFRDRTANL